MENSLKQPIIILANGAFPTHHIPLDILKNAGSVICTDGSANTLNTYGMTPFAVIGDFDSYKETKPPFSGKKILESEQDNTDLEKALNWSLKNGIEKITILGATGLREDMTLANHYILFDYYDQIDLDMVTDHFTITCHKGQKSCNTFPGQIISILPQHFNTKVSTTALRHPLNEMELHPSAKAVSNQALGASFSVDASRPVLIFRGHPEN